MCFPRKPTLGNYNGNRTEWIAAYRAARIDYKKGIEPNPSFTGIRWKAGLIVAYERQEYLDTLTHPVANRLESKRLIDKILREDA